MIKFNLQRLLDLRERKEQAIAGELARARTVAQQATDTHQALVQARRDGEAQIASVTRSAPTVGEISALALVLEQLDGRLVGAEDAARHAEDLVKSVREQLTIASQDRQVLERLRERHLEAQRAAASAEDRTLMDAIALARFVRRDGNDGGPGGTR